MLEVAVLLALLPGASPAEQIQRVYVGPDAYISCAHAVVHREGWQWPELVGAPMTCEKRVKRSALAPTASPVPKPRPADLLARNAGAQQ